MLTSCRIPVIGCSRSVVREADQRCPNLKCTLKAFVKFFHSNGFPLQPRSWSGIKLLAIQMNKAAQYWEVIIHLSRVLPAFSPSLYWERAVGQKGQLLIGWAEGTGLQVVFIRNLILSWAAIEVLFLCVSYLRSYSNFCRLLCSNQVSPASLGWGEYDFVGFIG